MGFEIVVKIWGEIRNSVFGGNSSEFSNKVFEKFGNKVFEEFGNNVFEKFGNKAFGEFGSKVLVTVM
jgi:hypothetical protein